MARFWLYLCCDAIADERFQIAGVFDGVVDLDEEIFGVMVILKLVGAYQGLGGSDGVSACWGQNGLFNKEKFTVLFYF